MDSVVLFQIGIAVFAFRLSYLLSSRSSAMDILFQHFAYSYLALTFLAAFLMCLGITDILFLWWWHLYLLFIIVIVWDDFRETKRTKILTQRLRVRSQENILNTVVWVKSGGLESKRSQENILNTMVWVKSDGLE